MTELIAQARAGDEDAFSEVVAPYRQELHLHCYRILGSAHDADDALQETLLAAWHGLANFEGRASVRTWLYRVATSRCLNMLRAQRRHPEIEERLQQRHWPEPTRMGEVPWLEPYPDSQLESLADTAPGPEARYESREAVSLAFVTALQLLPPRQRAVLILRDVLGFRAGEVAEVLNSSEESVTSALKRARATLQQLPRPAREECPPLPQSQMERDLVERFTEAFQNRDVNGLVALLTHDVLISMPPLPFEYEGLVAAERFFQAVFDWQQHGPRLRSTRANGQPAFGIYVLDPNSAVLHAVGLLVLSLAGAQISALTRFDNGVLEYFELSRTLRA